MEEDYEEEEWVEEEYEVESDNIYGEGATADLVDNDEISPEEAGFMDGYTAC